MKKKRRLTTVEAQQFIQDRFGVYVTPATFQRWCRKWAKEKPDMVKQPYPHAHYQIDQKLLEEHFDGYSPEST